MFGSHRSRSIRGVGAATAALTAGVLLSQFGGAVPAGASTPRTFVPCSGANGGTAGLDAAITAANGSGGGTIFLAPRCVYTITSRANFNLGAGLTDVSSTIKVEGNGSTITRSPAAIQLHLFFVDPTGNLTLQGLRLTGGSANAGGAVYNEGALTLLGSEVAANRAEENARTFGGGIASFAGSVRVIDSSVYDNVATSSGAFAVGGGIYAEGTDLTVQGSVISGNRVTATDNAVGQGGGLVTGGTLTVRDSRITGNTVTAQGGNQAGGGIYLDSGTVSLERSLIAFNRPDNCFPAIACCPSRL
jgi:hypothetical protein